MAKVKWTKAKRLAAIEHILGEVSSGRSVNAVVTQDKDMPSHSEFWRWHMADETLRDNLAHARIAGVEAHLDDALLIADDATNDYVERERDSGTFVELDREHVQRSKLRIETRIKYAQMIAPRKYGPKLDMTSGGEKIDWAAAVAAARERAGKSE